MTRKRFFSFFIALIVLTNFYGCNAKNVVEDASENIKQGTESNKSNSIDLVDKVKDTPMNYSKDEFKKDLENKGLKAEKLDTTKPYFSVKSEDYKIVGGSLSVYEYEASEKDKIINDLKTVSDNGTVINGTKISWSKAPHIYNKGRVVVIYDGNNESTLSSLKEILGEPLIG